MSLKKSYDVKFSFKRGYEAEFKTVRMLGRGAFGTTYKVTNRIDSRVYALKSIQLSANINATERSRVLREAEVLSSLNSEHVVRYYAAWIEKADLAAAAGDGSDRFARRPEVLPALARRERVVGRCRFWCGAALRAFTQQRRGRAYQPHPYCHCHAPHLMYYELVVSFLLAKLEAGG